MKRTMAVILAGGEGERLSILSQERAKPAVPFGGKYRIIDFTLSNCVNSDIDDVVVLTQYNPRSLNDHIGLGPAVGPRPQHAAASSCSSRTSRAAGSPSGIAGTADAVLRNLNVIEHDPARHRPRPRRRPHLQDGLPAVRGRPPPPPGGRDDRGPARARSPRRRGWASSRSTSTTASSSGRRSPSSPRATSPRWASTSSRRRRSAAGCREDRVDFGANVIPAMLEAGARVFGYRFNGYWQDVGTIQSYWEANMAPPRGRPRARPVRQGLGHPHPVRGARPGQGRPDRPGPPQPDQPRLRDRRHGRQLACCRRASGSDVGAVVRDSIVMFDSVIRSGAVVDRAILDKEVVVGQGAIVGDGPVRRHAEQAGARPAQHRHHGRRQARDRPARRPDRAQRQGRGGRPHVRLRRAGRPQRRVGRAQDRAPGAATTTRRAPPGCVVGAGTQQAPRSRGLRPPASASTPTAGPGVLG